MNKQAKSKLNSPALRLTAVGLVFAMVLSAIYFPFLATEAASGPPAQSGKTSINELCPTSMSI